MDKTIYKIRKKFIIMATIISFCIISMMVITLNLLMNLNYKDENKLVTDIISQTALVNTPSIDTEIFYFKDLTPDVDGKYKLPSVNINNVDRIILHGSISSKDKTVSWYCGGGGLMFNFQPYNNKSTLVHKEYVFNKDISSVTVDFSNYNDVMRNGEYITLNNGKIVGDGLIVSEVWWTSSSKGVQDDNISIKLDSIEIVYKFNIDINNTSNYSIKHQDFTNVFGNNIPVVLNGISSFYVITDNKYNLLEINYGNLLNKIPDDQILEYVNTIKNSSDTGTILIGDNVPYSYTKKSNDNMQVIMFTYDGSENSTLRILLIISILVGMVLMLILFIIILIVSKNVIEPVRISFEKQKEFISNASHELKTPITVISATTDLLQNQVGDNRWIACIKEQSEKMGRLVNELLTLARISEIQSNSKNLKTFDISQTVSNAILSFECTAYEENKSINSNIEPNVSFLGDQNKISELVSILIDNAIKYSTANSQIDFSLKSSKGSILLECSNYCDDTSTFDVNRIFERFYRTDKSHSNEKEGFGLGLSIAQSIVEYHNGNIKATKHNNMVKFVISLPN